MTIQQKRCCALSQKWWWCLKEHRRQRDIANAYLPKLDAHHRQNQNKPYHF